jgi:hypothetical protein
MEIEKHQNKKTAYHETLKEILSLGYSEEEYIHNNPLFNGDVNIARYLALYEIYKQTLGLNGHIADCGMWRGSTFMYFCKLAEIFEPHSYTLVHGFDWFEGMDPGDLDAELKQGSYAGNYENLVKLIELQKLDHVARLHKMDVTTELEPFMADHLSLRFKIVFVDIGTYEADKAVVEHLWPRLVSGGVLLFDQYNCENLPGSTVSVNEILGDVEMRTIPWSRQPTSYVVKP